MVTCDFSVPYAKIVRYLQRYSFIFLCSCLKADERNRMSASQLLVHSFITPVISSGLPNGNEAVKNSGITGNDGGLFPVDQPEHEEPVPDFSFFSGVPGKSRVKCEFEELQFLGKGGFGNVIKVCVCVCMLIAGLIRQNWPPLIFITKKKVTYSSRHI